MGAETNDDSSQVAVTDYYLSIILSYLSSIVTAEILILNKLTFLFQVRIKYKLGDRWTELNTPVHRRTVKQVVYRCYKIYTIHINKE